MTMSMATNAHGAAATTFMPGPCSSGVAFRRLRAIHRTPQEAKETPSSRSARERRPHLQTVQELSTASAGSKAGRPEKRALRRARTANDSVHFAADLPLSLARVWAPHNEARKPPTPLSTPADTPGA